MLTRVLIFVFLITALTRHGCSPSSSVLASGTGVSLSAFFLDFLGGFTGSGMSVPVNGSRISR